MDLVNLTWLHRRAPILTAAEGNYHSKTNLTTKISVQTHTSTCLQTKVALLYDAFKRRSTKNKTRLEAATRTTSIAWPQIASTTSTAHISTHESMTLCKPPSPPWRVLRQRPVLKSLAESMSLTVELQQARSRTLILSQSLAGTQTYQPISR